MVVFKAEKKAKVDASAVADVLFKSLSIPSDDVSLNALKLLGAMLSHHPEAIIMRSNQHLSQLQIALKEMKASKNEAVKSLASRLFDALSPPNDSMK